MATVSHVAAPWDGEASLLLASEVIPLGLTGAHDSSHIFEFRSPQGQRDLILFCLRMRPLRWASQEPTNVAAVSLLAAPRDGEASLRFAYDIAPVGLLGTRERCGNFAIRNLQGRRGFTLLSV